MFDKFKAGDYVLYKGQYACVHGATKGSRYLIEVQSQSGEEVYREWVMPASITPLEPAISDLLRCIYAV